MIAQQILVVFGALAMAMGNHANRCTTSTGSDGEVVYNCNNAFSESERSIRNQYIVWLDVSGGSSSRPIRVQVPNYRINNLVQAGANVDVRGSKTPILIELARPEIAAVGQGEDVNINAQHNFDVLFAARPAEGQFIHFNKGGDNGSQRLTPLNGPVPRPPLGGRSSSSDF